MNRQEYLLSSAERLDELISIHRDNETAALIDASNDDSLTYSELDSKITSLHKTLIELGLQSGQSVAVCFNKSIESIAYAFAIFRANATYIPIDPELPESRILTIVQASQPSFLITSNDSLLKSLYNSIENITRVNTRTILRLKNASQLREDLTETAFVIFTSGSTGRPKGVCISHKSALSFLRSAQKNVEYTPPMRFLNVAPLFFDASILDIYLTLALGGTVVLAPKILLPTQLCNYLEKYEITDTLLVSSLLKLFVGPYSSIGKKDLSSLRSVWYGAEPCPTSAIKKLVNHLPSVRIIHGYGPTEATHTATMHILSDNSDLEKYTYLPIGKPLETVSAILVDDEDKIIENANSSGELLLSGPQVMAGYIDKQMNHRCFIELDGTRYYRTNDLARRDEQGDFFHLGRIDDVVKIQGHLVYLSEIEYWATQICPNSTAVAWQQTNQSGLSAVMLCIFGNETYDTNKVHDELSNKLPKYMLPNSIQSTLHSQEDLLMASGKLNRKMVSEAYRVEF